MNQFLQQENQEKKVQTQNIVNHKKIRFCQNCGSKLEERDVFCTECGEKVEIEIKQEIQAEEKPKISISSDRMNAILNARKDMKSTFSEDVKEFTKDNKSSIKEMSISQSQSISQKDNRIGYYVSRDSFKTEYLIIESIDENSVTGKISDTFKSNGYGNEFFSGTINGDFTEINGIQRGTTNCEFLWDLHFSGIISNDSISGNWTRIEGHSEYIIYNKM